MVDSGRSGLLLRLLAADARAPQRVATLHHEMVVARSVAETFAFFAEAANLQRITPQWLDFAILTPLPIVMGPGAEIAYRIRLYGWSIPWRSRIDVWEPGIRFVDRQTVGPYRWWRHEHRFEAAADGTLVVDHVEYLPRASWLSGKRVRRDLERIFAYRQEALRDIFESRSGDSARSD